MREVIFSIECWPRKIPIRITGYTFKEVQVLYVAITENGKHRTG